MHLPTGPPAWAEDMGDMLCTISLLFVICFGAASEVASLSYQSVTQPFTSKEVSMGMLSKTVTPSPPSYPLLL